MFQKLPYGRDVLQEVAVTIWFMAGVYRKKLHI